PGRPARCCCSTRWRRWPTAGVCGSPVASSGTAARCCSTSARSPTGRCRGRARTGPCTARSSRSPSASSSSATAACASARPGGARPEPQGSLSRYWVKDGGLNRHRARAGARVGAAWRAYRLRRDLSQSDLARLAGVSPSAISQVERGERGLSLETLMALSGRLNVTLDELLGGQVTPHYRTASPPPLANPHTPPA